MIQLFIEDPESGGREPLGTLSEVQLKFLVNHLEEEFEEDEPYYIDHDTVDYLHDEGAREGTCDRGRWRGDRDRLRTALSQPIVIVSSIRADSLRSQLISRASRIQPRRCPRCDRGLSASLTVPRDSGCAGCCRRAARLGKTLAL